MIIHQTLHGYQNGHRMLASSCKLESETRKVLLNMSDLSGQVSINKLPPYITGYPVPGDKYYAFAMTWYASEMERSGCVWTHTLLLDLTLLGKIRSPQHLRLYFRRPSSGEFSSYSKPIIEDYNELYETTEIKESSLNLYFQLAYALYQFPENAILLPEIGVEQTEEVLLNLWGRQWPRLKRSFSFCTCSLSLRKINGNPLDFQMVTSKYLSQISQPTESNNFLILDQKWLSKEKNEGWTAPYQASDLNSVVSFMNQYGSDVSGKRALYVPLFLAQEFLRKIKPLNLDLSHIINFLRRYFPENNEALKLRNDLFDYLFRISPKQEYYFLLKSITTEDNQLVGVLSQSLSQSLDKIWDQNLISSIELLELLRESKEHNCKEIPTWNYLAKVKPSEWINLDWLETSDIEGLIQHFPEIFNEEEIWQTPEKTQILWFNIGLNKNLIDHHFLELMLLKNNGIFASILLRQFGNSFLHHSLEFVLSKNLKLSSKWLDAFSENTLQLWKWIASHSLNPSILEILDHSLELNRKPLLSARDIPWSAIVSNVMLIDDKYLQKKLSVLSRVSSGAFQNLLPDSPSVIALAFQTIYDACWNGNITNQNWKVIGSSLTTNHVAKPEEKFLNKLFGLEEHNIQDWDKCGFLRRGILESFIIFKWPLEKFIESISNPHTFYAVLEYGSKSSTGKAYIRKLWNASSMGEKRQILAQFQS